MAAMAAAVQKAASLPMDERMDLLIKVVGDQTAESNPLVKEMSSSIGDYVTSMGVANRHGSRVAVCLNNIAIQASKAKSTTHDLAVSLSEMAEAHRLIQQLQNTLMEDFQRLGEKLNSCVATNEQCVNTMRRDYDRQKKAKRQGVQNAEKMVKKSAKSGGGIHDSNLQTLEAEKQQAHTWRQGFLKETLVMEREAYCRVIEACNDLVDEEVTAYNRFSTALSTNLGQWKGRGSSKDELSADAQALVSTPYGDMNNSNSISGYGQTPASNAALPAYSASTSSYDNTAKTPSWGSNSSYGGPPSQPNPNSGYGGPPSQPNPNSGYGGPPSQPNPNRGYGGPPSQPNFATSRPSRTASQNSYSSPKAAMTDFGRPQSSYGGSGGSAWKVLYDYNAEDSTGLSVKAGNTVKVDGAAKDGWVYAELNGVSGWIPETYVQKGGPAVSGGPPQHRPSTMRPSSRSMAGGGKPMPSGRPMPQFNRSMSQM